MTLRTQFWPLGMLCGVVLVAQARAPVTQPRAQEVTWDQYDAAGGKAYEQAHYAEAERHWKAGLKEAETFGSQD